MLRTNPSVPDAKRRVMKQGWLMKKAGSGIFSPWRIKFIELENTSRGSCLLVFNSREQLHPKHEILLENVKIDRVGTSWTLLKRGCIPFTLICSNRKYYLAALSKVEMEEWMFHLNSVQYERKLGSREIGPKLRDLEEDARSVYSVYTQGEDSISLPHSASISRKESKNEFDDESTVGSCMETLSFCSEPVLTEQELNIMVNSERSGSPTKPLARKSLIESNTTQNWHEQYLQILEKPAITEEACFVKDLQLVELIGNFVELASFHAKNIIDEYHVINNPEKRTLKLYQIGPDLSVSKDGIVFRFACDYDNATQQEIDYCMAKTSAELRSVNAVLEALNDRSLESIPSNTYTLLMAIIDYKGFRIIAHADIPDKKNVSNLHNLNPKRIQINERALESTKMIGKSLNLKSHTVQVNDDRRVRVYLSATVEIHSNKIKNQNYLATLRDIFPPVANFCRSGEYFKFRPEFLQKYSTSLCSDAFSPMAGASKKEIEVNNDECMQAARFLRENWIPAFVKDLDNMEICPFDSESLTKSLHSRGINIRYLGFICTISKIPFIRSLVLVEILARACKVLFRAKFRGAILHFRSVGATAIDDQMASYATTFFTSILGFSDKSKAMLELKLTPLIKEKFNYNISSEEFFDLPRIPLFSAIQYHVILFNKCGVKFADDYDYNFRLKSPFQTQSFVSFELKSKSVKGFVNESKLVNSKEEDKLAFLVSKHFKSLGAGNKLVKSPGTAGALTLVAAHYNKKSRYEEAKLYGQAAVSSAKKKSTMSGLASAELLFSIAGLQLTAAGGPDAEILEWYRRGLAAIELNWGPNNPISMTLHDRMAQIHHRCSMPEKAFEFHDRSLRTANHCLGDNHVVTAAYLTRAGCYLSNMGRVEKAVQYFTIALGIFQSSRSDSSCIAEVHYHFADALEKRGDIDNALIHSQLCRKIREQSFGFLDVRVIDSCRQLARLLLLPYQGYKGVLTPAIRDAYREAISCNEKTFRYLQNQQGLARKKSKRTSPRGIEAIRKYSGPLLQMPYGWTPPFPKNLMHKLTKEIVQMKLDLVESPEHRECIRMLRQQQQHEIFDAQDAKAIILKIAAVSPSVYLDDILMRVGHGDETAIEELRMVIILTENETVGLRSQ